MRLIAANYVFPVSSPPLRNGIVVLDDNNTIVKLIDTQGKMQETEGVEFYNGVVVPGFVNAHCHLELSYLKNEIGGQKNLVDFITQIRQKRKKFLYKTDMKMLAAADRAMFAEGITAVGDISNDDASLTIKRQSPVVYHTFIEASGIQTEDTQTIMSKSLDLYQRVDTTLHRKASLAPHAPYSVSPLLLAEIGRFARQNASIVSMHNQESEAENEMFVHKSGLLYEAMVNISGDMKHFRATGVSSLQSVLQFLPKENNFLLVHNIYTTENDIDYTLENGYNNIFWVLCPKSNILIQNKLPDVNLFRRKQANICLGTDSLASNDRLSILSEMQSLAVHYPEIDFAELLTWATLNGAKALNLSDRLGSLEAGKTPGIVLIENFDFRKMHLSAASQAIRLI